MGDVDPQHVEELIRTLGPRPISRWQAAVVAEALATGIIERDRAGREARRAILEASEVFVVVRGEIITA